MAHDLCKAIEVASRGWTGGQPSGEMLTATRAFLAAASEDTALLGEVAGLISSCEPGAATWIAVTCGTAVERGAPAELTGPAVIDLLRSWLPKLPEQAALLTLFRFLCQATVSHLARLPAQREAIGQDTSLLDRLGELQGYSPGAAWVREALLKTSGTLIFLHPPSSIGLRVQYTNVSNCFHLFSLMQTAIGTSVPGGRTPDAAIARAARGKSTELVNDEAWWHYGSAMSSKADLAASIWGEGLVREIPRVDGVPVILAWPPILASRVWDGGFLAPHLEALPADAVVESQLTRSECEAWLKKVGVSSQPQKKWWRF